MKILKPKEKLKDKVVAFRTDPETLKKIAIAAQKIELTKSAFIEKLIKEEIQ